MLVIVVVPVPIATSILLTVIRGNEEPIVRSGQPQLDCLCRGDSLDVRPRHGRALFHQMIHGTVPNPTTKDKVDTVDASRQSTATTAPLDNTLLRNHVAIDDFPNGQVRSLAKGP